MTGKRGSLELTPRQDRIYAFVRDYIAEHGFSPTIREIGDAAGLASTSATAYQVSCLEAKGYLHRTSGRQAIALAGQVMVDRQDLANLLEEIDGWVDGGDDGSGYQRLRKAAGLPGI